MRLWSLHPSYLDSKGLVALWREALLAQKVLQGKTVGYKNHPQLQRFSSAYNPLDTIATFLHHVAVEADYRNYHFDKAKIMGNTTASKIPVTSGQLCYELAHLLKKLKMRDQLQHSRLKDTMNITTHPLFYQVDGEIEQWEVT